MDPTRLAILTQAAKAIDESAYVDDDGHIRFGSTDFTPVWEGDEGAADLTPLREAIDKGGMNNADFDFVQLHVLAQVPHKGAKKGDELGPGQFPDQLAVIDKAGRYRGVHQLDLVLKTPVITVTEIQNGIKSGTK
jgi:hypothetical protein